MKEAVIINGEFFVVYRIFFERKEDSLEINYALLQTGTYFLVIRSLIMLRNLRPWPCYASCSGSPSWELRAFKL